MALEGNLNREKGGGAEKIKSAALEYNGETFLGANHGLAFGALMQAHPDYALDSIRDGFITSTGRFVSREEADHIAVMNGQKKLNKQRRRLDSDDLHQAA